MIGFGVCVGNQATFDEHAAVSFSRVGEADSVLLQTASERSIHEAYNELLDRFARHDDLEALVLFHEDIELTDPGFCDRVRALLASDEQIAVLGTVGARGVHSLAWWQGEVAGHAVYPRGAVGTLGSGGEVDALDGMLLVLSPWAVRNLRFDEGYSGFHAYDLDFCFTARAAGRKVFATGLGVVHHTKGGFGDRVAWNACAARVLRKWGLDAGHRRRATTDGTDEHQASLVIVLDDDLDRAQQCLVSVTELGADQPSHDVVIVADRAARSLDPLLEQVDGEATVVRGDFPAGRLDRALLEGIAPCRGTNVVLLRGMPVVTAGFLRPLCDALKSPIVAAATSVTLERPSADRRETLALAARRSDLLSMAPRLTAQDGDSFAGLCGQLERDGELTSVRSSLIRVRPPRVAASIADTAPAAL
ncbi:MAG TPA: glycosyltransferase [Conexibacter sp.]|jgi:hypothetical protein